MARTEAVMPLLLFCDREYFEREREKRSGLFLDANQLLLELKRMSGEESAFGRLAFELSCLGYEPDLRLCAQEGAKPEQLALLRLFAESYLYWPKGEKSPD